MTLLEEAKKISSKRQHFIDYTEDYLDLVLAWLNDEITAKQFSGVLNDKTGGTKYLQVTGMVLKKFYQEKKIQIKKL